MINIAVVDDSEKDLNNFLFCVRQIENILNIEIKVDSFTNAIHFLDKYSCSYDAVFMDIEMPYINGLDATKKLREIDKSVILIFLTNMAQFAINGYQYNAFDFLLKPITVEGFRLVFNKVLARIGSDKQSTIVIKSSSKIINLRVQDIYYIEADDHYIVIHSTEGDFRKFGTIKSIVPLLKDYPFAFCNRCFLVNLRYVNAVDGNNLMIGKDTLLISRPQRKKFLEDLTNYLANGKQIC